MATSVFERLKNKAMDQTTHTGRLRTKLQAEKAYKVGKAKARVKKIQGEKALKEATSHTNRLRTKLKAEKAYKTTKAKARVKKVQGEKLAKSTVSKATKMKDDAVRRTGFGSTSIAPKSSKKPKKRPTASILNPTKRAQTIRKNTRTAAQKQAAKKKSAAALKAQRAKKPRN